MKKETIRLSLVIFFGVIFFNLQGQCVFEEKDGVLAVEAEDYSTQEKTTHRYWYTHTASSSGAATPDPDPKHHNGASGEAYVELLPDTRVTHSDPLENGISFSNTPGQACILSYPVYFNETGKYFVWVRAYSTGSEDNGIHVGLDDNWPASGARMQWCSGKNAWTWESKQRTNENHCGEPQLIFLNVNTPGYHTIKFSMREDGFEFDKFVLSKAYTKPQGAGPAVNEKDCDTNPGNCENVNMPAGDDWNKNVGNGLVASYWDANNNALAINAAQHKDVFAGASKTFSGASGTYDITLNTLTEIDGESSYRLKVNGVLAGTYTNPTTNTDYAPSSTTFEDIQVNNGDVILVEFSSHTNGEIPEGDGTAYSRGRWTGLNFVCADGDNNPGGNDDFPDGSTGDEADGSIGTTPSGVAVTGEIRRWHKITLTCNGPNTSETANPNPFTDYRFDATFTHEDGKSYTVPGYYAACDDPTAGCNSGNKWKVHFAPDRLGKWTYTLSFKSGNDIAINAGGTSAGFFDGKTGDFTVGESNKTGRDSRNRAHGRLSYTGEHYLRFAATGEDTPNGKWFVKAGADAPENMLAYEDFDATPNRGNRRKSWQPHQQDYDAGDASAYTWGNGKGTEMLGVVNYLHNKGVNAFSFLTLSLHGDDENVFPYLMKVDISTYNGYNDGQQWNLGVHHDRFDNSKLAQWEKIFEYGDKKGMFMHFKTLETENDNMMDNNTFGRERKIYYRELIARFGHHLQLNWNMTEESTIPDNVIKQTLTYVKNTDPYNHLRVLHTYPGQQDERYNPLLGNSSDLMGTSIQTDKSKVHDDVVRWLAKSANAGKKWVVSNDEQGSANIGVDQDGTDDKLVRHRVLWGTLMGGGTGVEYYYGYQTGVTDLNAENHRSRDLKYTHAAIGLQFFNDYLLSHLASMTSSDGVTADNGDYVLAKAGEIYAVYRPNGGTTNISLPAGSWSVQWFNPRTGGGLTAPTAITNSLVAPDNNDWVALITNDGGVTTNQYPVVSFTNPLAGDVFFEGNDLGVTVDATDPDGTIEKVELYINDVFFRQEGITPYEWGTDNPDQTDDGLLNLAQGTYVLKAIATDNEGAQTERTMTIEVFEKGLVMLSPVNDAYLQGAGGTNFNTADLRVENNNRVTYLMFDLSNLPSGVIERAELELTVGSDAGNGTIVVYDANNGWDETTVNGANAPGAKTMLTSQTSAYDLGVTYTFDVANADFTGNQVSFILEMDAGGNDVSFASKEHSTAPAPKLTVKVNEIITSIDEHEALTNTVYPNPAQNVLNISSQESDLTWEVMETSGRVISTGEGKTIPVVHLSPGVYLVKVNSQIVKFYKE